MRSRWLVWACAVGMALPFAWLLPREIESHLAVAGLVAAIAGLAALAASRALELERGGRLAGGFAALFVLLVLLGLARAEHYPLDEALTDLALLYLIFYAAFAVRWRTLGRVVLVLPTLLLVAIAVVRAAHAHIFGFEIGAEGYRAMLQTNTAEAREFFDRFVETGMLALALAVFAIAAIAALRIRPVRLPARTLALGGACAVTAAAVLYVNSSALADRAQGLAEAAEFAGELREYRALREARRGNPGPAVAQQAPLADKPQTYVFVIGESLTRNHMSLYGYWRETTPQLERLSGELAVFTDVVSPHSHTDLSLERVLTLAKSDNSLRFTDPQNYSLIDILRAAGFRTWWISNQNTFGAWDNKTAALGMSADQVEFANKATGRYVSGAYDEVLLAPFAAALADPAPRKAIFLHFLGSHWEYDQRYPAAQAAFRAAHDPREIGARHEIQIKRYAIVHYDNSVRYHDALVARLIERLRAAAQPTALVMFSDHGESLFEARGHYWKQFTRDHVEVPLILWFSPEYLGLAGPVLERARAASRQPFALEDLPFLVADVAQLKSAVLPAARSPLSPEYRPPRARALFEGQLVYEQADEPLLNARRALVQLQELRPRLWAHRVNTLGKMMEAARLFDGVEIDVLFRDGELLVNHPPAAPSGLTLDEQLAYANRLNPKLALWLDLKNLDEANVAGVLAALRRLDERHSIRGRALVETPHTGPAAGAVRAAGFTTSYYAVPAADCPAGVEKMLAARRFAAVSYDFAGRAWFERCLRAAVDRLGLKTYTWDLEHSLSRRDFPAPDAERRKAYAQSAAVLLSFRSRFEDWR